MRNSLKFFTLAAALVAMGCGSDETVNFNGNFPNNPLQLAPPTAVADAFTVLGNGQITGSVTVNDTVNGATVTQFQNPGTAGGAVTLTSAGALTYTPPAGQSNIVDTFTYTLGNSGGSSTATVTVTIGARGFFVKNDGPNGTGSQTSPFNTLANGVAAAAGVNGAAIRVFRGDGTSTGLNTGATLSGNQTLQGQDPANPPLLTGPITLTQNNTLSALNFQGTVPAVVNGTNAVNGTVSSVNITTTGNKAVFLGNATGTWNIQNSRFANANFGALDGSSSTGTLIWTVSNCTFTNCFGSTIGNVTGSATQTLTVRNNTFNSGRVQEVVIRGDSTATNMTLTMTNNTVNGAGTALRGLDILGQNTCNVTASVKDNVISGCTSDGINVEVQGVSGCAARFNNNRLTGNDVTRSFSAGNNGTANLRLALDSNTADRYVINNGGGALAVVVETLATLTNRNVGTFATSGLIDGSCPAP